MTGGQALPAEDGLASDPFPPHPERLGRRFGQRGEHQVRLECYLVNGD